MQLDAIRALQAVVDTGSQAGAADHLGIARTTLRRRLGTLEAEVGGPLFSQGDADRVLTPLGRRVLELGVPLLEQADQLSERLKAMSSREDDVVTVIAPVSSHPVAAVAALRMQVVQQGTAPMVLRFEADPVESLRHAGDFALHFGTSVPEGPWVAQRVATLPLRLMASTAYADRHGLPRSLDDLAHHTVWTWVGEGIAPGELPLIDRTRHRVPMFLASDHLHVTWEGARAGACLALAPSVNLPGDGWDPDDKTVVLSRLIGLELPVWVVSATRVSSRPSVAARVEQIRALLSALQG